MMNSDGYEPIPVPDVPPTRSVLREQWFNSELDDESRLEVLFNAMGLPKELWSTWAKAKDGPWVPVADRDFANEGEACVIRGGYNTENTEEYTVHEWRIEKDWFVRWLAVAEITFEQEGLRSFELEFEDGRHIVFYHKPISSDTFRKEHP